MQPSMREVCIKSPLSTPLSDSVLVRGGGTFRVANSCLTSTAQQGDTYGRRRRRLTRFPCSRLIPQSCVPDRVDSLTALEVVLLSAFSCARMVRQ